MFIKTVLKRYNSDWDIILGDSLFNSMRPTWSEESAGYFPDCAVMMYGPELIRNRKKYNNIIQHLTDYEADRLVEWLGFKKDVTSKKTLVEHKIRKNSRQEKIVFDFFDLEYPEKIKTEKFPDVFLLDGQEYPLYSYQKEVLLQAMDCYHGDEKENLMIHMPTGSGKTRVAMNIVSRVLMESKTRIIWMAFSEELCEQAISEFEVAWKTLGDRPVKVGRFFGRHKLNMIDDGLMVVGLSKLYASYSKDSSLMYDIANGCNMVVFDEAHQSVAPTYLEMLDKIKFYNEKCVFMGLSATPGRMDEEGTRELATIFDSNKIELSIEGYRSPIQYFYKEGYLARPTFYELMVNTGKIVEDEGGDYPVNLLKAVGSNSKRNEIILNSVIKAITEKHHKKVLVFAASVDSAKFLMFKLKMSGIDAMAITSDTESELREAQIKRFKQETEEPLVMCNFGVLTTGFDVPSLDCVVIARPTTSLILYSQMVGRALRGPRMNGTENADIITIADTDLPGYGSVIQAFRTWDTEWRE